MLFFITVCQVLFSLTVPRVQNPHLPLVDTTAYDGSTDVAISHYGYSPSYEISTAYSGFTTSYDISTARLGAIPLFEHVTCHFDYTLWKESGECVDFVQPLSVVPLLLVPRKSASLVSLLFQLVGRLVGLCASFVASLPTFLLYLVCWLGALLLVVLRDYLWFGLCARVCRGLWACFVFLLGTFLFVCLSLLSGSIIVLVGCLSLVLFGISFVALNILDWVVYGFFSICIFVGHTAYDWYLEKGLHRSLIIGVSVCIYYGFGAPLFVFLCGFSFRTYCTYIVADLDIDEAFTKLFKGVSTWCNDVTNAFIYQTWRYWFSFFKQVVYCCYRFLSSFIFYGFFATIFFYGVRSFIASPTFF